MQWKINKMNYNKMYKTSVGFELVGFYSLIFGAKICTGVYIQYSIKKKKIKCRKYLWILPVMV